MEKEKELELNKLKSRFAVFTQRAVLGEFFDEVLSEMRNLPNWQTLGDAHNPAEVQDPLC